MRRLPSLVLSACVTAACSLALAQSTGEPAQPRIPFHLRELREHARESPHPAHFAPIESPAPGTYSPRSLPCKQVHGFLPYWVDPRTINWDVLTHLACYAILINPDGTLLEPWAWPWTGTIQMARQRGIKVYPTITMGFEDIPNMQLLTNPEARERLIQELRPLLTPHADGLYIDLEGNGSNLWAPFMPGFIAQLKTAFQADNPNFEIFVATPANDVGFGWDYVDVAHVADGLYVMCYDFFGPWSDFSGPCSPLTNLESCILVNIDSQYAALQRYRPDRLIAGIPYYANEWVTQTDWEYSTVVRYVGTHWYDDAARLASLPGRSRWDFRSKTPWAVWEENGEWHQLWYDDDASLALKYNAFDERHLGGIGMWAVGYDRHRPELANLIRERYINACRTTCPADVDDGSGTGTLDGGVTIDDLLYFLLAYAQGHASADLDDGTSTNSPDGGVTIDDLLYYLLRYERGC